MKSECPNKSGPHCWYRSVIISFLHCKWFVLIFCKVSTLIPWSANEKENGKIALRFKEPSGYRKVPPILYRPFLGLFASVYLCQLQHFPHLLPFKVDTILVICSYFHILVFSWVECNLESYFSWIFPMKKTESILTPTLRQASVDAHWHFLHIAGYGHNFTEVASIFLLSNQ